MRYGPLRAPVRRPRNASWADGAGVHTGTAWVGRWKKGQTEATAVGDARTRPLRHRAHEGEILVTTDAATAAGLRVDLPRRNLELKGKELVTEVVTLTVDRYPEPS